MEQLIDTMQGVTCDCRQHLVANSSDPVEHSSQKWQLSLPAHLVPREPDVSASYPIKETNSNNQSGSERTMKLPHACIYFSLLMKALEEIYMVLCFPPP